MSRDSFVTGNERFFDDDELIVSKTDLKGRVTYCNDVFLRLSDYSESDMLGEPHSIIRHPQMPRCVFKLLWQTLESGKEIFAYVINRSANGDHYWVNAHVTPSYDGTGQIVGYHSNRRVPDRNVLETKIIPLYKRLSAEEERHTDRKEGLNASIGMLTTLLQEQGVNYDEFIATL